MESNFNVHSAQCLCTCLSGEFSTISGFGNQHGICNFLAVGQTHFQTVRRGKVSIIQNPHNLSIGPNFRLLKNLRRYLYLYMYVYHRRKIIEFPYAELFSKETNQILNY